MPAADSPRVTLITGGGRGIGAACARLAAAAGHAVCVNYARDRDAAEALVAALAGNGARAIAVQADVSVEADVERLFATCDRELGRLTGLVNNAGVVSPPGRVDQMDAERIRRVLSINVLGAFLAAREAVRRMSTRHGGAGGVIATWAPVVTAVWAIYERSGAARPYTLDPRALK